MISFSVGLSPIIRKTDLRSVMLMTPSLSLSKTANASCSSAGKVHMWERARDREHFLKGEIQIINEGGFLDMHWLFLILCISDIICQKWPSKGLTKTCTMVTIGLQNLRQCSVPSFTCSNTVVPSPHLKNPPLVSLKTDP